MERLLGKPYDFDVMLNVPLIISMPDIESAPAELQTTASAIAARPAADIRQTVHTVGGQIDFLPTIAYLFGIEDLDVHFGHNLLVADEGFVAVQTYMRKGSFIKNDVLFEMSRDGVFESSRAKSMLTGEPVPLRSLADDYERSLNLLNASEYVLVNNVIAGETDAEGS
jgi:phosphoglycerol transferase MdoB-like AlkP superfamily enzyme